MLNRERIIQILIEDKVSEWVDARMSEGLEYVLEVGWKGYDTYTDQELEEAFSDIDEGNFDQNTAEEISEEKDRIELGRLKKLKFSLLQILEEKEEKLSEKMKKKNEDTDLPF